jgi:methylthioribose-1-phosphate isomerase
MSSPQGSQKVRSLEWLGGTSGFLRLLDQTFLPTRIVYCDCHRVEEVWEAIRGLRVRGAPAIGIAAAYGIALACHDLSTPSWAEAEAHLRQASDYLRPSPGPPA